MTPKRAGLRLRALGRASTLRLRALGRASTARASKSATKVVLLAALLWMVSESVAAEERKEEEDVTAGEVRTEEVDSTRLDVSRLPPEAIEVTRDLYARGFFVEAMLGATGFLGDLGDVSKPGPRLELHCGRAAVR